MTENKKPEVIFAPGCFDTFDGTQEELEELMKEIQSVFANMTPEELKASSRQLTEEEFEELIEQEQLEHVVDRKLQ